MAGIVIYLRFRVNPLLPPPLSIFIVCLHLTPHKLQTSGQSFLPERDYVTFGSWLSQFRLSSVVCLSVCLSVTLVHPTQRFEPFGKISSPLCTLAIL